MIHGLLRETIRQPLKILLVTADATKTIRTLTQAASCLRMPLFGPSPSKRRNPQIFTVGDATITVDDITAAKTEKAVGKTKTQGY